MSMVTRLWMRMGVLVVVIICPLFTDPVLRLDSRPFRGRKVLFRPSPVTRIGSRYHPRTKPSFSVSSLSRETRPLRIPLGPAAPTPPAQAVWQRVALLLIRMIIPPMIPVTLLLSPGVRLSRRHRRPSCPCSHAYRRTPCVRYFLLLLRCAHPYPPTRTVEFPLDGHRVEPVSHHVTARRLPAGLTFLIWFQGRSLLIGPNLYPCLFFRTCRRTVPAATYLF